ncbi:MAG TPA: histidine kinase [Gaiellaceae bacterium]|nr:histidine kinase [Gaiellaceae bacterium]
MRWVRLALWPLGALWVGYVASVLADTGNVWYYVLALLGVGAVFISLGLVTWERRPQNCVGPLMVAIGFAWLLLPLRYSRDSLAWTLALALPTLHQALLVHLLFAYPTGRVRSRFERALVLLVYAVSVVGSLAVAMFQRDAPSLGYSGPSNLVLVSTDVDAWRVLREWLSYAQAMLAVLILLAVARRFVLASPPARRRFAPLLLGGIVAALLFTTGYTVLGYTSAFLPDVVYDWRGFGRWLVVGAYALLPFAFSIGLLRERLAQSAVADLVADLGRSPSAADLRRGLVRALGDSSLVLGVWSDDEQRYANLEGVPVELPTDDPRRAVTMLEHDGRRLGAIVYDAALRDDPGLVEAASAAARLALENERLRDELRAQLADVQASRARIVEAGTAERRRLERDLHDGAQQQLVRLSLLLQLARSRAGGDRNELPALLSEAGDLAKQALGEIRALAQGLHPAIVTEEGLSGALEWLAESATLPVRVLEAPEERLPESVEMAAYFVASEALANIAKHAQARSATVQASRRNATLVIEIVDDGVGGADPSRGSGLRGLADRVAALDGRLGIESPPGSGTRIHVEIPCA